MTKSNFLSPLKNSLRLSPNTGHDKTGSNPENRLGFALILASAIVWSFGGALKHFITAGESWTIVFWRSVWAALFLLAFMLVREGRRGTLKLFANMGLPGICVAICFAIASTCFIVALAHTTVANILLMQAGVPLIAACVSGVLVSTFMVTLPDMGILIVFGGLNLGLGLALFATGVRLVPSALAALLGTTETVLGPIWMWLIHDEIPTIRTMIGGLIVLTALLSHISWRIYCQKSTIVNKIPI